ncbi:DUF397 domain-containing protein [Streptomyces decoyicus]|uniref:DUF397 domain-containing protein n=1 Tax=Streptomyces decoyicus TaxID=249567 RepID=UPI0033A8E422
MRYAPVDLSTARWRKSSYSNSNGGECIEIADDFPGLVPVRDSKNPHGPALLVPDAAWTEFVDSLKKQG